jgi:hypothetical protein
MLGHGRTAGDRGRNDTRDPQKNKEIHLDQGSNGDRGLRVVQIRNTERCARRGNGACLLMKRRGINGSNYQTRTANRHRIQGSSG